jgi:hypothetical protein
MLIRITDENFMESLIKYKRFIWFIYIDDQDTDKYRLSIKPSWSEEQNEFVHEINNTFEDIIIAESKIGEVRDTLFGFSITDDELWDDHNKHLKPFFISVDKGWMKDYSIGRCYCLETVMDMIHGIYPEYFQE